MKRGTKVAGLQRSWIESGPRIRAVLNGKKKVFRNQFSQQSPRELQVLNHGWWRLAVGSWQLVVGGGWWWLAAVGGWRLVVGDWWLAVGGWWSLGAVPYGQSLAKKKKNLVP